MEMSNGRVVLPFRIFAKGWGTNYFTLVNSPRFANTGRKHGRPT